MKLAALILLIALPFPALSSDILDAEIEYIATDCKRKMAKHGPALVQSCIDQEVESLQAVSLNYTEFPAIQADCIDRFHAKGWAIIQSCIEHDIEAQQAVDAYRSP